jgi:hypothetical protein
MGAFLVRHVDIASRAELARFAAPNVLAYEGIEYVCRQLFPPYQAAMTFALGMAGPTARAREMRPNEAAGDVPFGPKLTFAHCTDANANEGGCYTNAMRTSFGYVRRAVAFAAAMETDGGTIVSPEVTFPNDHSWTPQDAADWDFPWTPDIIEQPPPEWTPRQSWEPVVGYPWQRPRKRSGTDCDPNDPDNCLYPYMHPWDASGELDWLADFRKMGGFPVTLAFLADSSRSKLIAAAVFAAPVLLRPGTALHVIYQARIFGRITRDFAVRFATYAFEKAGSRYATIYCRPLLAAAPAFTRRTTYADVSPFFHAHFGAVALPSWTYVPYAQGPPEVLPHVESATAPQWTNTSGAAIGPFGGLAVYGLVDGENELMWVTRIDPPVSVPNGDSLRVPDKARFQLDGI